MNRNRLNNKRIGVSIPNVKYLQFIELNRRGVFGEHLKLNLNLPVFVDDLQLKCRLNRLNTNNKHSSSGSARIGDIQ